MENNSTTVPEFTAPDSRNIGRACRSTLCMLLTQSPESPSSWSEPLWPASQLFLVSALKQIPRVRWFPCSILPWRKRPDKKGVHKTLLCVCVSLCVCINSPVLTFYLIRTDDLRAWRPALKMLCPVLWTPLTLGWGSSSLSPAFTELQKLCSQAFRKS